MTTAGLILKQHHNTTSGGNTIPNDGTLPTPNSLTPPVPPLNLQGP
jgi:hypothetical protein